MAVGRRRWLVKKGFVWMNRYRLPPLHAGVLAPELPHVSATVASPTDFQSLNLNSRVGRLQRSESVLDFVVMIKQASALELHELIRDVVLHHVE